MPIHGAHSNDWKIPGAYIELIESAVVWFHGGEEISVGTYHHS